MTNELVNTSSINVAAIGVAATLPELAERAGGAVRFAREDFFFAEHHNLRTQRAYESAVRRFLDWADGQGVDTVKAKGQQAQEVVSVVVLRHRAILATLTAITDLLTQGVPLKHVQYLAGHSRPRTTELYGLRQKKVTRNIVERISI